MIAESLGCVCDRRDRRGGALLFIDRNTGGRKPKVETKKRNDKAWL
jgi:hypothetical protein